MKDHQRIINELVKTGKWGKAQAERAVRSNFKCEYCDKDLLASVENFKEWQEDHIIPLSSGGKDEDSNIAVSCRTCNVNVKSRWNPLDVGPDSQSREDLIEVVREYVTKKRTDLLDEVSTFRKIVFGV
jgi:5-methylcytosine-specific restriction endonuclease McrA